jgi:predicted HD phosphohydrolase
MLTIDDIEPCSTAAAANSTAASPSRSWNMRCRPPRWPKRPGADDELVTACLLHDLGHLLQDLGDTPTLRGVDDVHQYAALPFLRGLFGERVLGGIALHVDAKRYLCATRPTYHDSAVRRFEAQPATAGRRLHGRAGGGLHRRPGAADAVQLRLWDDLAKTAGAATPPLSHFLTRARRCANA